MMTMCLKEWDIIPRHVTLDPRTHSVTVVLDPSPQLGEGVAELWILPAFLPTPAWFMGM